MKKLLSLIVVFVIIAVCAIPSYAAVMYVDNLVVNEPDTYTLDYGTGSTITGKGTVALSTDLNFASSVIAGKKNSITRTVYSLTDSPAGYANRFTLTTTKPSDSTYVFNSLSVSNVSGTSVDSRTNYVERSATCLYFIVVSAYNTATYSTTNKYISYPSVSSQV